MAKNQKQNKNKKTKKQKQKTKKQKTKTNTHTQTKAKQKMEQNKHATLPNSHDSNNIVKLNPVRTTCQLVKLNIVTY